MNDQSISNEDNIGLSDNRSITEVWRKLKHSIFDVLFVLLDNSEQDESMIGLCLETGIDYLQMMTFPFQDAVISAWGSGETIKSIRGIVDKINVQTYIPGIEFDTFIILLYALIFLIITVILDIIYVAYSFSKKKFKFTWPLVYLAKIVPLIVTVMFLPIMETLLEVVNCSQDDGMQYPVMVTFPDVKCWEGWHLVHSGITLIFSSVFVFISCIVTLTVFEPRMTTNRLTSRKNSSGQVIFIINKIICQFVFSFSPFSTSLPYSILLFVLSGWLYSAYNIKQPYYSKKANKFFRVLSTYYFWTNFMLLVSELLKPFELDYGLVVWLCGIVFFGISIIFQRKSNIDTLFSSSLKFKSGEQLESHLQYVLQLHHNRNIDNNSYMLLLGYIEKHIQICLDDDCPLSIKPPNENNCTGKQQQEFSCQMLLKLIESLFKFGVKKYPQCTKLRLTFAFFYMEKLEKKSKAFQQFTRAINTDPSFGEQFIIYRFRKIITEKLEQNQEENDTDLIDLIRFDNYISLCQQGMAISGKLHKQFWIQLMEESPNLSRLNLIGGKITETFNAIEKNYDEVFKVTTDHTILCQLQYNYALYLIFVVQNIKLGKSTLRKSQKNFYLKKFKIMELESIEVNNLAKSMAQMSQQNSKIFQQNSQEDEEQSLNNEKSVIVIKVSEQSNYSCKIMKCNRKFLELVKYEQNNLIDHKLEKVLPSIFQNIHDLFVKQWVYNRSLQMEKSMKKKKKKVNKNYLNIKRVGYLKDSSNCLRKVEYQVKFLSIQKCFWAQFTPCSNLNRGAYFLTNINGKIFDKNYEAMYHFPRSLKESELSDALPQNVYQLIVKNGRNDAKFQVNLYDQQNKAKDCLCTISFILSTINNHDMKINDLELKAENSVSVLKSCFDQLEIPDNNELIAIVVNITPSLYEASANKFALTAIKNKVKFDKTTNYLSSIDKKIHKLHRAQGHRFRSIYEKNESQQIGSGSKNNLHYEKKLNYSCYVDENGKECEIKAYRYFNNNFKRIYFDDLLEEESDYDYEQKMTDLQAKLSREKIINEKYQQRISKAINTYIYHPEICQLFNLGLIFVIVFLVTNLVGHNWYITDISNVSAQKIMHINETFQSTHLISRRLLQILYFQGSNFSSLQQSLNLHNQTLHYSYTLERIEVENFQLEDGVLVDKDIQNCLLRLQGNILRYIHLLKNDAGVGLSEVLDAQYHNFLVQMFDDMNNNYVLEYNHADTAFVLFICFFSTAFLSITLILAWIYNSLRIKNKMFGVLIWFLDIPMEYLTFAYQKCLYFNKNYMSSKKMVEKQIQIDKCEHYIQEYTIKATQIDDKEYEIEESEGQQKLRKILINRYRKQSLMEKLECKQFNKLWIILFLNAYLISLVFLHDTLTDNAKLIVKTENIYAKQLLWQQSLIMIQKIKQLKENEPNEWSHFTFQQIEDLTLTVSNLFAQTMSCEPGPFLNISIQFINQNNEYTSAFSGLQFKSLCLEVANQEQKNDCSSLLSNLLVGGYSLIKREFINFNESKYSGLLLNELYMAQKNYISKSITKFMEDSMTLFNNSITSMDSLLSILLYAYTVVILVMMLVLWNLYLRMVNTQLNQTIRILNMIPMHLFPVSRIEIREFLKWLIKKSGEQGSEAQLEAEEQKIESRVQSEE